MLAPQPNSMPARYEDKRTDWQIYDEICHIIPLMHGVLCDAIRDYESFHDRVAADIAEINQRKARRIAENNWPAQSTTLVVAPKRSYNLHASIEPGCMRIVEAAEAREAAAKAEAEDWGRRHHG
jgi:hypothetical protein